MNYSQSLNIQFNYYENWGEFLFQFELEITENYRDGLIPIDPVRSSDWKLFFTVNSPTNYDDKTNPLSFPLFIGTIGLLTIIIRHLLKNKK